MENREQAVIPKKTAGASAIIEAAFDRIEIPRLLRKHFRLIRILESGVTDRLPPQSSISRTAAAKVRGAVTVILRIVINSVTAS